MIMDVELKKDKILNSKGQALVEFMLFLPFVLMMYSVTLSISNALNGAINQQKITRGMFYYRAMHNSSMPKPRRDDTPLYPKFRVFGQQILGWSEKLQGGADGGNPLKACYKFRIPLGNGDFEASCEEAYRNRITQFIKLGTVYGICAETHETQSGRVLKALHGSNPLQVIRSDACSLSN